MPGRELDSLSLGTQSDIYDCAMSEARKVMSGAREGAVETSAFPGCSIVDCGNVQNQRTLCLCLVCSQVAKLLAMGSFYPRIAPS
jgi:hypothetical protein